VRGGLRLRKKSNTQGVGRASSRRRSPTPVASNASHWGKGVLMPNPALKDRPPFAGHSPDQERPLGGYATLTGLFFSLCATFGFGTRGASSQSTYLRATSRCSRLPLTRHRA